MPTNVHRRNYVERAICTLKSYFLSILAGVDPDFPKFIWYTLLQHTELTLNLLHQATINVIHFQDIPKTRINEVCYTSVLCQERPGKIDPNRTCITICGTNFQYPGGVGTKTSSLEILKLIINSVILRAGENFVAFDISNFYLDTPMKKAEYVKMQFSKIPQECVDEYKLQ